MKSHLDNKLATIFEEYSIFRKIGELASEVEDADTGMQSLRDELRSAINTATEALKDRTLELNPLLEASVDNNGKLTVKEKESRPGRKLELAYDQDRAKFRVVGNTVFQKVFRTGYHHRKALTPKGNSDYIEEMAHEVANYFKETQDKKLGKARWESRGLKT